MSETYKKNEVEAPQPAPLKPGDNPNTMNAKRRIRNRLRTKNSEPKEAKASGNKSTEPNLSAPQRSAEALTYGSDFVYGYYDVDLNFPKSVSSFLKNAIEGIFMNSFLREDEIHEMKQEFVSQVHFKAARQLFSAISESEKSQIQPLKAVYYEETKIPVSISQALQIIGHFDVADQGKVIMKDAPYVFQNWVWKGVNSDYDHMPIWRDDASYSYLRNKVQDMMIDLCETPVAIETNSEDGKDSLLVKLVPNIEDVNFEQACNAYRLSPKRDELLACADFLRLSISEFKKGSEIPEFIQKKFKIIRETTPVSTLSTKFSAKCYLWNTKYRFIFEKHITCGPAPVTMHGLPAVTMTNDPTETSTSSNLSLSDSDASIGWLYIPVKSFHL